MPPRILSVDRLRVTYGTSRGPLVAVEQVSFTLNEGDRFGLVGESGSGKSTIALALMRLVKPPGEIVGGHVELEGTDLLSLTDEQMRNVRLKRMALVPQGAMNSLNPVLRVQDQIRDALQSHERRITDGEFRVRLHDLLDSVGLRRQVAAMYPHELSGGMRQRVCIAIATSLRPRLIIADEPTSALDVVVQRQIMGTLRRVQEELGASLILIGHDIGLMAQSVEKLGIMYAGEIIEVGPIREILARPLHPYSQGLIASLPSLTRRGVFRGLPPPPRAVAGSAVGAPFLSRCPVALARCAVERPRLQEIEPGHWVACHLYPGADA